MTNTNTRTFSGIFLIFVFTTFIYSSQSLKASYQVTKTYLKSQNDEPPQIKLGKLKIFEEAEINQAYVETNEPIFVNLEEVQRYGTVILVFKNEQTGKQYKTAVSKIVQRPHSEKIVVVLSSSKEVIGFNYIQIRIPNQDISVQLEEPEKGVDHVFKVQTQQKQPVQEQSFFAKYKWPLIIGGIVLYMSMSGAGGPDKAAGQGQAAQQ